MALGIPSPPGPECSCTITSSSFAGGIPVPRGDPYSVGNSVRCSPFGTTVTTTTYTNEATGDTSSSTITVGGCNAFCEGTCTGSVIES